MEYGNAGVQRGTGVPPVCLLPLTSILSPEGRGRQAKRLAPAPRPMSFFAKIGQIGVAVLLAAIAGLMLPRLSAAEPARTLAALASKTAGRYEVLLGSVTPRADPGNAGSQRPAVRRQRPGALSSFDQPRHAPDRGAHPAGDRLHHRATTGWGAPHLAPGGTQPGVPPAILAIKRQKVEDASRPRCHSL